MTYLDAHYARLRLADDLNSPLYRRYISGFVESRYADTGVINPAGMNEYLDTLVNTLEAAETFTMSPNMHSLVHASAIDMPNEVLRPEDLPSKEGFLWLAEPIAELDIRGRLLRHHAVLWGTTRDRVVVWWFADRNDNLDEMNQVMNRENTYRWRDVGRFMLAEATTLYFGQHLPASANTTGIRQLREYGVLPQDWEMQIDIAHQIITDDDGRRRVIYVPTRHDDSTLSDEEFALIEDAYAGLPDFELTNHALAQLTCFWRLCQQTLSARHYEQPNRALRKQMIRRKLVPKAVTVIILRRRKSEAEGQNTVEWDHRWVRRGHWRQQWFGPQNGDRYQRAIYINPTICGPEDKPLIIRPHVNVLKR